MKKKLISLLLVLSLMLSILPLNAQAADVSDIKAANYQEVTKNQDLESASAKSSTYLSATQSKKMRSTLGAYRLGAYDYATGYGGQLDESQKAFYDLFVDFYLVDSLSVTTVEDMIIYSEDGDAVYASYSLDDVFYDVFYAYFAFAYDYPQAFWAGEVEAEISYYEEDGIFYIVEIYLYNIENYEGSMSVVSKYNKNVKKAAADIYASVPKGSDVYDYYKAIHDWICKNVTYNYPAVDDPWTYAYAYSNGPVFTGNPCVTCQGYSEAYKVLCNLIHAYYGVDLYCAEVMGDAYNGEAHMWNYVYMPDGKWYAIDTVWDDQDTMVYTYFMSGANTPGFDATFAKEHVEQNYFDAEGTIQFAYPVLAKEAYKPPQEEPEQPAYELKFSGASLTLQDNLAINFKAKAEIFAEGQYEDPYVVFSLNGKEVRVDDYKVMGTDYIFPFTNIAPNQMNDTVTATLYAKYKGVDYSSKATGYSVATYCYNMLGKSTADAYAEFRTLLVDLLNYGAASQIYTNYKTSNLVNASLTNAQKAWGTKETREYTDILKADYATVANPKASWKGAGLNLKDRVEFRLTLQTENVANLSVKVTADYGNEWVIPSEDFISTGNGKYDVCFNGLNAAQMSKPVYFTVYENGKAVSNTARYSVESYVYKYQNNADTKLADLVVAMMKYGDSAYNYIH